MTTAVQERIPTGQSPFEIAPDVADQLAENVLDRTKHIPDDEMNRKFDSMMIAADQLHLPEVAAENMIDDFTEQAPAVAKLVHEIYDTADLILESVELDRDSSITAENLAKASDIFDDDRMKLRTVEALEPIHDEQIQEIKRALEVAVAAGESYEVAKERLAKERAKKTLARIATNVPPSKRPEKNDEYGYLTKRWHEDDHVKHVNSDRVYTGPSSDFDASKTVEQLIAEAKDTAA